MTKARSMTGFGAAVRDGERGTARVELRSLNHRFLELSLNLPQRFFAIEGEVRAAIAARIKRARVDCWVSWEPKGAGGLAVTVDRELMAELHRALEEARLGLRVPGEVGIDVLVRFPEVVRVGPAEGVFSREVAGELLAALAEALDALDRVRAAEAEALVADIRARVEAVAARAEEVARSAEGEPRRILERMRERLAALASDFKLDPDRLAQEAALLADRVDVTEELVRLRAHLERARRLLEDGEDLGKQLDFLLQEIGREINTIGSKSRAPEVSERVLAMKAEVEKIREQARNLE